MKNWKLQPIWVLTLSTLLSLSLPSVYAEDSHSGHDHAGHNHAKNSPETGSDTPTLNYKYVCPMHPQIIRDHEGTCPICGMDLVKQAFENDMQAPKISAGGGQEGLKQGLAIRTTAVKKLTLWKYIPTFGRVVADQSKVMHIHPWASGRIRDLAVRSNGESVKKGQLLYRLYSQDIVSAQQDLLLAIQSRQRAGKHANTVLESARERLQLLGLTKATIRQLEKRQQPLQYVPFYAEQDGVVSNLSVQNGMFVTPQIELMTLSDLSTVWVEADVLPLQQEWIKTGLTANITTSAFPSERWEGDIDYIYPEVDSQTLALVVRIPLLNPQLKLKPNMLTDVEIYGGPKRGALTMPMEAVINDGFRKRAVKQLEDGRFQVVEVVTGMQTRGVVEVLAGLSEGERVVLSGQFLIDSESQIQENLRRLMSTASRDSDDGFTPLEK